MDPDENLKKQLALATKLVEEQQGEQQGELGVHDAGQLAEDAETLAELVLALDEWIKKGGFLPKDWQKKT